MKVTVLGSGVIGITTAYFLAKAGHKVIVVDRQSGSGKECSYSNAAQLSYYSAQPWANFGALAKGIKWMGRSDAPLRFRLRADVRMWLWLFEFALNCNSKSEKKNTKNILDLCLYSKDVMHKYESDLNFDFDYKKGGKIFIFDKMDDLKEYQKHCQFQETLGGTYKVLDTEEIFDYEPNLKHLKDSIVGAIMDPEDESGDCYKFCVGLENKLKEMGVEFRLGETITDIQTENKKVTKVITDKGEIESDMFVMSLGTYSPVVSRKIGISLPIHPLKGYSLTVDIKNKDCAPLKSITYYSERTVFGRLGNRMRVSGTAEFAGFDHSITPERIEMLKKLTQKVFPDCGDLETAEQWACLRPCTPSGVPIISNSKYENLVLNTGQGSLGWTMAMASAKLTADLIDGKQPEIDITPYKL